jgi:carboxymethylenebutenolidase
MSVSSITRTNPENKKLSSKVFFERQTGQIYIAFEDSCGKSFRGTKIPPMTPTTPHALRLLAGILLLSFTTAFTQAQDWAKARLDASPRHHEYVALHHGSRTVQAFVVYPEIKGKAPVVILIHEIFGLTDWAKEMADELAGEGFIVVAPDLLSAFGPNGGGSSEFPSQDAAVKAVSALDPDGVNADLDAAADFAKKIPAGDGKIAVVGFCWGGGKSFAFATHRKDLSAAFVFYGPGPSDVTGIVAPVYGFYGGNDARIGSTIPATTAAMKAAGKQYEQVTYDGAGHGFMRAGEDPNNTVPGNKAAREQGLARLVTLLHQMKSAPRASNSIEGPVTGKRPATSVVACHETDNPTETASSMQLCCRS